MVWWFWVLLVIWIGIVFNHVHIPAEQLPQRRVFPVDRQIVSARSFQGHTTYMISTKRVAVVVSIPLLYLLYSAIGVGWFLASLVVSLILLVYFNLDELKKVKLWFLEDLHIPLVLFCLLAWCSQPVLRRFEATLQAILSEIERCCVH